MTEHDTAEHPSTLDDIDLTSRYVALMLGFKNCREEFGPYGLADPACREYLDRADHVRSEMDRRAYVRLSAEWRQRINDWADATFGNPDITRVLLHLKREVDELIDAWQQYDRNDVGQDFTALHWKVTEELADCFILLNRAAVMAEVDPIEAQEDKFAVLLVREWGEPDAEGVIEHIRTEAS